MTAQKLVISFSLLVFSLFSTPLTALAVSPVESTPSASATTNYQLPPTVSPTSPLYTDLMINNMFHTFSCLMVGQSMIGQPCLTYRLTQNAQGMIQGVPVLSQTDLSGGTLGAIASLVGTMYANPPVRSTDYLASVSRGLGLAKEAQAQGVGGAGEAVLNPILALWQVSRNVAYIILIIIFLIIGLMVMFRNKINPQTVVTAQAALPGLVIGLIMITFSYFFAGLISDMAFVGTNFVGFYFSSVRGQADKPQDLVKDISSENILSIFGKFTSIVRREDGEQIGQVIFDQMGPDAQTAVRWVVFTLTSQFLMPLAGVIPPPAGLIAAPIVSLVGGAAVVTGLPFFLGIFLAFAAALALVWQMLKLLLRLLTAYLTIIFLTISAPFQFLMAALPGRQGAATGWIRNMLANVLIFPAVLAIFYFVVFLLGPKFVDECNQKSNGKCIFQVSQVEQNDSSLVPAAYATSQINVVDTNTFPLFGGVDLKFMQILLAFGALMALPTIPDLITRSIGKGGQAGQAIGQEIMGGFGQGRGYVQKAGGAAIGYGQATKTSLLGEQGMLYNPKTGEYYAGYSKAGFFNYKKGAPPAKKGGVDSPTEKQGLR